METGGNLLWVGSVRTRLHGDSWFDAGVVTRYRSSRANSRARALNFPRLSIARLKGALHLNGSHRLKAELVCMSLRHG